MKVKLLTEIGNHDCGPDHVNGQVMTMEQVRSAVKEFAEHGWQRSLSVCVAEGEIAYAYRNADRCGDTRPEWRAGYWGIRGTPDGRAVETGESKD